MLGSTSRKTMRRFVAPSTRGFSSTYSLFATPRVFAFSGQAGKCRHNHYSECDGQRLDRWRQERREGKQENQRWESECRVDDQVEDSLGPGPRK